MENQTPAPNPFSSPLTRFTWVSKRDGRIAPFEADKICQSLFAATERLGKPSAFMARELADSVLHFLGQELAGTTPSTAQIAEIAVKVVRELGQPALARAFAERMESKIPAQASNESKPVSKWARAGFASDTRVSGPSLEDIGSWIRSGASAGALKEMAARPALESFCLREVYSRDLIAAHEEGLLTLTGLDAPLEIAASIWPTPTLLGSSIAASILEARELAGSFIALDGPEYHLARLGVGRGVIGGIFQSLRVILRLARLRSLINLNSAVPPPSAEELAAGPLFSHRQGSDGGLAESWSSTLLDQILQAGPEEDCLAVDWHVGERDFAAGNALRLHRVARRCLEGLPIAFVFDRPRRTVALAEGLDQRHPALLLSIRLNLPCFLNHLSKRGDADHFLQKLPSLSRLALSAALQRREFLRRQGNTRKALVSGFLLERARLAVVPVGMESVARTVVGESPCVSGTALAFVRSIVETLKDSLRDDGRGYLLDCGIDSCFDDRFAVPAFKSNRIDLIPGLTLWDEAASPRAHIAAAGALHGCAEAGTVVMPHSLEEPMMAEEMVELLQYAWRHSEVVRIQFAKTSEAGSGQTPFWEKELDAPQDPQ
jgi:hypothetical protein